MSSWNRPAKKRVRCVLPERAIYARALCRWVDVGLGARGLGEGDKCNQFTFHHKFRIDTGRPEFEQKTDSILSACESCGQRTQRS